MGWVVERYGAGSGEVWGGWWRGMGRVVERDGVGGGEVWGG